MRRSPIFAIALALCFASESSASDRSFETWNQLWMFCRNAVEQGESLNGEGLTDLGPSTKVVTPRTVEGLDMPLLPGWETPEHMWQYPDSAFVIVVVVKNLYPRDVLAPSSWLQTLRQSLRTKRLIRCGVMKQRLSLIVAGTHEERNPDPIFTTKRGVGPFARSANGCSIISVLQIETRPGREPLCISFSAEQSFLCLPET